MSLRVTPQEVVSPSARIRISPDCVAPTAIQRRLFDPGQHDLASELVDVVYQLGDGEFPAEFRSQLLDEHEVSALDGAYARIAAQAARTGSSHRLIEVTRHLGGQTSLDIRSSLDDIETGPVAIFAAASTTPTVELILDERFFDECKSTQRQRLLQHLRHLTPGFDVRLTGSRLVLRKLLNRHRDVLPASVSERAQSRLMETSTVTEEIAHDAEQALDELGTDHSAWGVAASIARTPAEQRAYSDIYADNRFAVSDSAIRKRLARLRETEVVGSLDVGGDRVAALTVVGKTALDKHPDIDLGDLSQCGWSTEHTSQTDSQHSDGNQLSVNDPRNDHNSTVVSQHAYEGCGDGPVTVDEAAGSPRVSSGVDAPSSRYLSLDEHHAAAAAASSGHFALVDRDLDDTAVNRDHRETRWSFDDRRDEVVVSVDWSPIAALTAVRLCAVLLSDHAFEQVLTKERLAGQPGENSLEGLYLSNPYVLRRAACVGWLRDVDTTADGFRRRLETARRELLAMTDGIRSDDGSLDEETLSELLRKAHGLMGVVVRLYDLLDVDVVRELRFPNGVPSDDQERESLQKFLAIASSVSSRYGAYAGYRVLHEDREPKRADLLSEPDIDPDDPAGTLMGSWVLSGEGASTLQKKLEGVSTKLELQDDGEKFAPVVLDGDVVDGNRRQAVAEATTRLLSFKEGLRPDRQAISMLSALSGDVFAAAQAVSELGHEERSRSLDMQDVRYGLSRLDPQDILPEMGGDVVSSVVATLLDAQEPLSTAEVADLAGCHKRSLSTDANEDVFAMLEAAGLIEREDLGEGKATLWRLRMPFRSERHDVEPLPAFLVGRETSPTGEWQLTSAVFEVLTRIVDEHGRDVAFEFTETIAMDAFVGPPPDRDLVAFVRSYPQYQALVELLATLLDQRERMACLDMPTVSIGATPATEQVSISTVLSNTTG